MDKKMDTRNNTPLTILPYYYQKKGKRKLILKINLVEWIERKSRLEHRKNKQ